MRVLVIGGTGLISTPIVERLLETGHDPVLFNRGKSDSRLSREVEAIHGDRDDFEVFAKTMGDQTFDAVIDMITFDPATAAHAVEVFGGHVAQYVFCSTVCVYGGPLTKVPADEDEPHTPVSEYGKAKSEAETVFMDAHASTGFPVTMFRPSHCYGPGQPLLDIFGYNAALVSRIRDGRPILVSGDGYGMWQPGYIDDLAKGFVGCLGRDSTIGKTYNIVGDEIMTWRSFHQAMGKALGCEVDIACLTCEQICAGAPSDMTGMLHENFQYHAAYSNALLKADVPEYADLLSFEEGVRRTVQWLDETDGNEPSGSQSWIDALVEQEAAFRGSLTGSSQGESS
ncbi:MAG: NAD-dependent epimerase/dehydratase family protein [bacterium]|nr:NAD-dependent epimerase/dehydratase family protein [bacterium]